MKSTFFFMSCKEDGRTANELEWRNVCLIESIPDRFRLYKLKLCIVIVKSLRQKNRSTALFQIKQYLSFLNIRF